MHYIRSSTYRHKFVLGVPVGVNRTVAVAWSARARAEWACTRASRTKHENISLDKELWHTLQIRMQTKTYTQKKKTQKWLRSHSGDIDLTPTSTHAHVILSFPCVVIFFPPGNSNLTNSRSIAREARSFRRLGVTPLAEKKMCFTYN